MKTALILASLLARIAGQSYNQTINGVYNVPAQPGASKAPTQLHINQWIPDGGWRSGNAATMMVWASDLNYACPPTVEIGTDGEATKNVSAVALSEQYTRACNSTYVEEEPLPEGETIIYISPFIHKVEVMGLKAAETYTYRVGATCEGAEVWSSMMTYTTPPAGGQFPKSDGQTFAIIGDLGQTEYSTNTVSNVMGYVINSTSLKPESAVIVGDLAYADGDAGLRWDTYEKMIEPLASILNILVLPGNHEVGYEFDAFTNAAMVNYVHR